MAIPQETIDEILRSADIAEVARAFQLELKPAGGNTWKACCPFHHEKTPSFHIDTSKQVYHCFGCGEGGSIVTLVKKLVNTDFVGAMQWLAQRYNITIPEEPHSGESAAEAARHRHFHDEGMRLLTESAAFFQEQLRSPAGAEARQYLVDRGIDEATVQKYGLGFAPDSWEALATWANEHGFSRALLTATGLCLQSEKSQERVYDRFRNRLMFPICNELGKVVAFSGRVFGAKPAEGGKYVNSPESEFFHKGRVLYGFHIARQAFSHSKWALVCEGQLDVIACHRAGLLQAIAAQGTAFTEDHAKMLAKTQVPCVHLAFDGDPAGHKATLRTIKLLQHCGIQVLITTIPEHEDPDSIFRTGGASALQSIMSQAEPAIPFVFRIACQNHPDGTPEARSAIVSEMLDVIATLTDEVTTIGHCQWLAGQLHLPEEAIQNLLRQKRAIDTGEEQRVRRFNPRIPPPDLQLPKLASENDGVTALTETMLDLAVHFQSLAEQLAEDPELLSPLTDCPAKQALTMLLAGTADGDWEGSLAALAHSDLCNDRTVSAVLVKSRFDNLLTQPNDDAVLQQALQDCLNRLQAIKLQTASAQLAAALNQQPDDFSALAEAARLARERQQLRNARRHRPTL
ncbi:MAG: DNA primase [Victivallales bacterium]|nr:DNA primase [Victivallales bacterium]